MPPGTSFFAKKPRGEAFGSLSAKRLARPRPEERLYHGKKLRLKILGAGPMDPCGRSFPELGIPVAPAGENKHPCFAPCFGPYFERAFSMVFASSGIRETSLSAITGKPSSKAAFVVTGPMEALNTRNGVSNYCTPRDVREFTNGRAN